MNEKELLLRAVRDLTYICTRHSSATKIDDTNKKLVLKDRYQKDVDMLNAFIEKYYETNPIQEDKSMNQSLIDENRETELGNLLFGRSRGPYPIDRIAMDRLSNDWNTLLDLIDVNAYGVYYGENEMYEGEYGGFKCDLFEISPYLWNDDLDDEDYEYPNFSYHKGVGNDLKIMWYKYPFRDSYASKKLSVGDFKKVLADCIQYTKKLNINQSKINRLVN